LVVLKLVEQDMISNEGIWELTQLRGMEGAGRREERRREERRREEGGRRKEEGEDDAISLFPNLVVLKLVEQDMISNEGIWELTKL
jgi:hypothetical protein